ncbi:MAG: hypothetical protein LBV34_02875 [Nocardiopsaceae bacterium]|nr:hypothetical protein [Nocardiopsaceae bacterium]
MRLYVVPKPGTTVALDEIRNEMEYVGVARFKLPEHLVVVFRQLLAWHPAGPGRRFRQVGG